MKNLSQCNYLLLALLLSHYAYAQKDEIIKRLKAEQVKSNIYLHIVDNDIFYMHDVSNDDRTSAGFILQEDNKPMWVSRSGKLRLSIGFFNPYQYSVKVNSETSVDPIAATTGEFFAALTGMLGTVTTGTPIAPSTAEVLPVGSFANSFTNSNATVKAKMELDSAIIKRLRSLAVVEWSLWASSNELQTCKVDGRKFSLILQNVDPIETLLYHAVVIDGKSLSFAEHTTAIAKNIFSPVTSIQFSKALGEAASQSKSLRAKISIANSALKNLPELQNELVSGPASFCKAFPIYTKLIFAQYQAEAGEKLKKMEKVLETLDNLIKVGQDFVATNKVVLSNGVEKEVIFNKELRIEDDQINTITIEVKRQELDTAVETFVKTKKEFKRSFDLTLFRRAWPEVSTGVFYSDIQHSNFTVGETTAPDGGGQTTSVIQETKQTQRFMVALFYNQVFDLKIHPIYPFLQFGVGTSKDYPALLVGGGFRLLNKDLKRVSVAGGWVFPFTKELGTKNVGDPVKDQAEIDKDIQYRLGGKIGFYIGVAWKIN